MTIAHTYTIAVLGFLWLLSMLYLTMVIRVRKFHRTTLKERRRQKEPGLWIKFLVCRQIEKAAARGEQSVIIDFPVADYVHKSLSLWLCKKGFVVQHRSLEGCVYLKVDL